jgi:hypothetical protein
MNDDGSPSTHEQGTGNILELALVYRQFSHVPT